MDTSVETRRGYIITSIIHHGVTNVFVFLLVVFAFKWLYALDMGMIFLFSIATVFYLSNVYSYSYTQAKIDFRNENKYNFLMPLKIGVAYGINILFFLTVNLILAKYFSQVLVADVICMYIKVFNYCFFRFIYGPLGHDINYGIGVIIALLPILAAYIGYILGIKKFSFNEKIYKFFHHTK